jgi:S-adenosylmethionine:tRNA ribosyltransferase-isomerase
VSKRPSYPVACLDYDLPQELIAQEPLAERTASRLLHVRVASGEITDRRFSDLLELLPHKTLIVLNDSKVIPARVYGRRPVDDLGQGGGRVEVLFHRWLDSGGCEAVIGSGSPLPVGAQVQLPGGWWFELLEAKRLDGIRVRYIKPDCSAADASELMGYLDKHGLPPLPPYIKRAEDAWIEADRERYQTVYAASAGSVAAPTAGLHFNEAILAQLARSGHIIENVTLHVGLGTFAPVRVDDLADHEMHEELFLMPESCAKAYQEHRAAGEPVLAVGTTSLRVLHTVAGKSHTISSQSQSRATRAFIYPGHGTDACDLLLTNFHLPRSTLLALVYAFGGEELLRRAYAYAIEQRYRFYSYGDCMLIDRRGSAG